MHRVGFAKHTGELFSNFPVLLSQETAPHNELDVCPDCGVSAAEFLTHMAEVSGLPPTRARTRAADTLRHAGLFEERYRAMGGYSTGMKQRVKLAQALVHDPAIIFLDEPTAGLDPAGREEMLDLVRKTHREFNISILLSSHLMADVERSEATRERAVIALGFASDASVLSWRWSVVRIATATSQ